ncbi:MAG TPA: isoprenoid biosynthesis glyoxalase ElbB [Planctomycetota bacterium]|jgi:enhancing lycopene biosynthesis protein 2|nr:isoprenoid biosynthesis glyoxalase ElbB [Planctomycetota bacterium]
MARIGVLLSGCGVMDGSEIHEAVLTLLSLDRAGAEALCMAPDAPQRDVVNHWTGRPAEGESRNCLVEAARIARGNIRDLATVKAGEIDGLILPGGYGAAKNLSDFAVAGGKAKPHPEVARLVGEVAKAGKPIGAICIAPATVASVLAGSGATLTVGNDKGTAAKIVALGCAHEDRRVREVCVDRDARIVSTPAYMLATRIGEAAEGIEKLVREVLALVPKPAALAR